MNLYFRFIILLFRLLFLKKKSPLQPSHLNFRAWPLDLDIFYHVTNSRYFSFMDLGRIHLLSQSGVLFKMLKNKYYPAVISSEISFIKQIELFEKVTLSTRLISWDSTYWYIEHKFICTGNTHAVAHVRGLILKKGRRLALDNVFDLIGEKIPRPPLPESVQLWTEMLEVKKKAGK